MRINRKRLPKRRDVIMVVFGAAVTSVIFLSINLVHKLKIPLKPQTSTITSPWVPSTVKQWEGLIDANAKKYNVDPNLIAIIITLESGGNSKAQSEADAKGLMQITAPTASDIASKYLKQPRTSYDLFDPATNIEFGTAYLSYLRNTFGDPAQGPSWNYTVELVAAGYNGGPGAAASVDKGEGLNDTQTVVYSRDAFNMWRERNAKTSPTYNRWLERGGSELISSAKQTKTN